MLNFILSIVCLAAFYGAYFVAKLVRKWWLKSKRLNDIHEKTSEYLKFQDEIIFVNYKGYEIPMKRSEKTAIWDNLTSDGKKKALSSWKNHLNNNL